MMIMVSRWCRDCGKMQAFTAFPEGPTDSLIDLDTRRGVEMHLDLKFPETFQGYMDDLARCFDCGKKHWDNRLAEADRKRADQRAELVKLYSGLIASGKTQILIDHLRDPGEFDRKALALAYEGLNSCA